MGRHSPPEDSADPVHSPRQDPTGSRFSARRRAVAICTVVALALATGAAPALRGELLGPMQSCSNDAVRLGVAASPDIAPALREAAERARSTHVRSDGRCLDVKVTSRVPYEVADALGDDSRDPGFQVAAGLRRVGRPRGLPARQVRPSGHARRRRVLAGRHGGDPAGRRAARMAGGSGRRPTCPRARTSRRRPAGRRSRWRTRRRSTA